jgi:hypothetical protein
MIGSLLLADKPIIEMQDDGTYTPVSPTYAPLAEYLNASYSPTADSEAGDSQTAFGVAALHRAAAGIKSVTVRLAQPVPELPKGAIP